MAALLASSAAAALPAKRDAWVGADTVAFSILSNSGDKRTAAFAGELETFRRTIALLLGEEAVAAGLPTHVFLFKSGASYAAYDIFENRAGVRNLGWFATARQVNQIAFDSSTERGPEVILHEYVHFLVENSAPGTPLWLNEGLAELYSTFRAGERGAEIGRPIDEHLQLLRGATFLPLDELFGVDRDSPLFDEGRRTGVFYAQSWLLTHYLLIGEPDLRPQLRAFLDQVRQGRAGREALSEALGWELEVLESRLRSYLNSHTFAFSVVPLPEPIEPSAIPVRSVDRPEALARLGSMLAQLPEPRIDDADEHCRAALDAEPGNARALLCLARVDLAKRAYDAAEEWATRSLAVDDRDPLAHELLGHLLFTRTRETVGATGPPPGVDWIPRARAAFERALALSPSFAPALAGLGLTYLWDEDVSPGLELLERAVEILPQREDIVLGYIALAAQAGAVETVRTARELLERPGYRASEAALANAERNLFIAEVEALRLWMTSPDRYPEALARLEALISRAPDETFRRQLEAEHASLAQVVAVNLAVARYNEAGALVNEGRHAEARPILEELAASEAAPEIAERARTLLASLPE